MLKLLTFIILIVFMNSCGVDTSSSGVNTQKSSDYNNSTDNNIIDDGDGYVIDPNPITVDDGTGGTPDDNGTSGGGDTSGDGASQEDSIFDVNGAVLDKNACYKGNSNDGYTNNKITDNSIDDRGVEDAEYGVFVNSKYPLTSDSEGTDVTLFYYDLKPVREMLMVNIYEERYRISIDKAWGFNEEDVMYVMTPKNDDGYYSCYRYNVSSIENDTYVKTKVYRKKL